MLTRAPPSRPAGSGGPRRRRGLGGRLDETSAPRAASWSASRPGSVVRSCSRSSRRRPQGRGVPAQADRGAGTGSHDHEVLLPATCPATTSARSRPAGGSNAPAGPVAFGGPTTRDSRKTRSAPRSRSRPTRYQRPCQATTPRLHAPAGWDVLVRALVAELELAAVAGGGVAGLERGLPGVQAGLERDGARAVDVDTGGLELDEGTHARRRPAARTPEPQGQADGGRFLTGQPDLGEFVVGPGDAVAVLGVEDAGPPGLQGHAHLAELGLVALEHPLERLVGLLGAGRRRRSRARSRGSSPRSRTGRC